MRCDRRACRNLESGHLRIIGDAASGEVEAVARGIEEFDEACRGILWSGEELIENQSALGEWEHGIHAPRCAADEFTGPPGAGIVFTIAGAGENKRMTRACRGDRPRRLRGVTHLELGGTEGVAESKGVAAVVQRSGEGPHHIGDAVNLA